MTCHDWLLTTFTGRLRLQGAGWGVAGLCEGSSSQGFDIPTVDLVVNYDLPRLAADYVHRCAECMLLIGHPMTNGWGFYWGSWAGIRSTATAKHDLLVAFKRAMRVWVVWVSADL
jgi:hypothetical protein